MNRRRIAWPLIVSFVAAVGFLVAAAHGADAVRITKAPYLQNAGPTAITVQYEASAPGDGQVRYGVGALGSTAPAQLFEKVEYAEGGKGSQVTVYLYRARLTGLKPGTEYQYQVVHGGVSAPAKTLRTWPEQADRVTFIAYGDTRTQPDKHRAVARNFARHDPAFILNVGDLITDGNQYWRWDHEFFDAVADVMDHVPMIFARGNHEKSDKNLLRLFDMPDGRTWTSFTYGPVHVVVLDNYIDRDEVLTWLAKDLAASTAPWKIVMAHEPAFNFSGHVSESGRKTFLPILERTGVDVFVTGHSHEYERFAPLARVGPALEPKVPVAAGADAKAARHPMTFITSGGGGAPPCPAAPESDILLKSVSKYHYCVFTVDRETLRMQAFTSDGKDLDAFTITKKDGRYDQAYMAQAKPMEAAILAQGLIRLEAGLDGGAKAKDADAEMSGKVRFTGLTEPATVEARLAEASAKAYAMDPVTVTAKPGEEPVLSVKVRPGQGTARPALRLVLTARVGPVQQSRETADIGWPKPGQKKNPAKSEEEEK